MDAEVNLESQCMWKHYQDLHWYNIVKYIEENNVVYFGKKYL